MNVEHILPTAWGAYADVVSMLRAEGVAVRDAAAAATDIHGEPSILDTVKVFWSLMDVPPPPQRQWAAVAVFVEALGSPGTMLAEHIDHWRKFCSVAPNYDAVVVHTPAMAARIRTVLPAVPVFVIPLGWSPTAWGAVPVARHVEYDLVWWGSLVGRRREIFPWLRSWCQEHDVVGKDLTGAFGLDLITQLRHAACAVYVAHSKVESYSTWRLWQCVGGGVPLLSEPVSQADAWPFTPGLHFEVTDFLDVDADAVWDALPAAITRARTRVLFSGTTWATTAVVLRDFWDPALVQIHLAYQERRARWAQPPAVTRV